MGNDDNAGLHYDEGVNEHEWATRWDDLDTALGDTPREALPEAVGLLHDMLVERGVALEGTPGAAPTEDVPTEYRALRETADVLDAGEELSDEDVEDAVGRVRELYRFLIDDHREWGPMTADEPDDE